MKKKIIILLVVILAVGLVISGCQIEMPHKAKITGGGWLLPPDQVDESNGKATFGFTVELYDIVFEEGDSLISYEVKGHLTYVDHFNGVKIIGPVTGVFDEINGGFTGTYGDGGTFVFMPVDDYDAEHNDWFSISVAGGEHDSYTNEGLVEEGSIQAIAIYNE